MADMAWHGARVFCVDRLVYVAHSTEFYELGDGTDTKENSGYSSTVPLTRSGADRDLTSRHRMQRQDENPLIAIRSRADFQGREDFLKV